MSGPQLRRVVADTSALVSLGVPSADAAYDTATDPDPLQFLLTSCTVVVPPEVVSELESVTQYQDVHGAAAANVLAARSYLTVEDPYQLPDAPDSRPRFGLDDGETDGIVLANTCDADGFLTDEFGGTNFAVIHAALRGPRIVPTPRLLQEYAHNGHLTDAQARALIETISPHRSWDESPYVMRIHDQLE